MTRRAVFAWVRVVIGVALLFWLWKSGIVSWGALGGLLRAWPLTLLGFAALSASFVVISWRLCILLEARGFHVALVDSVRLSLIGNLFGLFLPTGGSDVVRVFYAAVGMKGRRTELATIFLLDRIVGLVAILTLPLLIAPFASDLLRSSLVLRSLLLLSAAGALGIVAVVAALLSRRLSQSRLVTTAVRYLPFHEHVLRIMDTLRAYRGHADALAKALAVSLLVHSFSVVALISLFSAMHGPAPWASGAYLTLLGFVANNIPLSPGGLGIGEAAFDRLFRIAGISGGADAMIAWRVLLIGLAPLGLWLYLSGRRLRVESRGT